MNSNEVAGRQGGCDEYVNLDRRGLLDPARWMREAIAGRARTRLTGAAAAAMAGVQGVAFGQGSGSGRDVLVYVMLRGGADGLTLCPPYGDPDYVSMRGPLAVPPPGQTGGAIDLDGTFGMSPALGALLPAWQAGDLAFLQGAGSTDPTRSHFDAMKFIEGGVPDQSATVIDTGWLGRYVAGASPVDPAAPLRAMAIDSVTPLTLFGAPKMLAISDPPGFDFDGWGSSRAARKALLAELYDRDSGPLRAAAAATIETVDRVNNIDFAAPPGGGALYPDSDFGDGLRAAAALIRGNIGLEAIQVDRGGWDHHDDMGPNGGQMYDMMAELAQALAAFRDDLGSLMSSVTVICMGEFGRRVDANGSAGTDHGRGGCMIALGGNVNGGQVLRSGWQGLDPALLDDLAVPVTIDYRDVLVEALERRLGFAAAGSLFPNHTPSPVGVFA